MREYKFRVRDKKNNKWLFGYPEEGGFCLFGEIVLLGEIQKLRIEDLRDIEATESTGREDENRKEIFEGDRVRFKHSIYMGSKKSMPATGIITWDNSTACFFIVTEDNDYPHVSFWGVSEIEVIGNIYEEGGKD